MTMFSGEISLMLPPIFSNSEDNFVASSNSSSESKIAFHPHVSREFFYSEIKGETSENERFCRVLPEYDDNSTQIV